MEIRDLDSLTTAEDVEEAIERHTGDSEGVFSVRILKANSREPKMALVQINARKATQLLNSQRIKIGWVYCRVRQRIAVNRCYKCLDFGHTTQNCRGPDRSNDCLKCGTTGHKAIDCTSPERCVLCKEKGQTNYDHQSGSGRCCVFKTALDNARKSLK